MQYIPFNEKNAILAATTFLRKKVHGIKVIKGKSLTLDNLLFGAVEGLWAVTDCLASERNKSNLEDE